MSDGHSPPGRGEGSTAAVTAALGPDSPRRVPKTLCGRYVQTFSRAMIVMGVVFLVLVVGLLVTAALAPSGWGFADQTSTAAIFTALVVLRLVVMVWVRPFTETGREGLRVRTWFLVRRYRWGRIQRIRVAAPNAPTTSIRIGLTRVRALPGLPPSAALGLEEWFVGEYGEPE